MVDLCLECDHFLEISASDDGVEDSSVIGQHRV